MLRGRELVVGCFPARAVTCTRTAGEFRVVLGTWLARLLSGHRERDGLQLTANGLGRGQLASLHGTARSFCVNRERRPVSRSLSGSSKPNQRTTNHGGLPNHQPRVNVRLRALDLPRSRRVRFLKRSGEFPLPSERGRLNRPRSRPRRMPANGTKQTFSTRLHWGCSCSRARGAKPRLSNHLQRRKLKEMGKPVQLVYPRVRKTSKI